MSNEELVGRAHGEDVLSPTQCNDLTTLASKRKKKQLVFFNGRNGWLLRRVVREHNVIRAESRYCALCSANNGPDLLRSRVRSECSKCHVHLCTVPREEENALSCGVLALC